MNKEMLDKMDEGKDKELMKLVHDGGKPFVRKHDGYAVECKEDKEITYKDHNDQELTLKVPKGSYIVVKGDDHHYPEIHTAEDFEYKNKFVEGEKSKMKKEEGPKIGIELMSEGSSHNSDY